MELAADNGHALWGDEMGIEGILGNVIGDYRFTEILHKEAQARGLVLADVAAYVEPLYYDLLPPGYDREETIVIGDINFTAKERAVLITFMKLQSKWSNSFSWREELSGRAGEGNVQGC